MAGNLHVVLAIDTEGPVYDPKNPGLLSDWAQVDDFLARVFRESYRRQCLDSCSGGLVISWFVLNWTGFSSNPVRRDFGYHRIHDHYMESWGKKMQEFNDGIYWHYHHPSPSGIANEWCKDWSANREYLNILNRLVVDRAYFPSVFRAGGTIETNEMSSWLEQWIPFDYSNRAGRLNWDSRDSSGVCLRDLCDWSRAPSEWGAYHPSFDDYQQPGSMRRAIFRCLDLCTGVYSLSESDIDAAFVRAQEGEDTILAVFDHDYRDRADLFVESFLQPLQRVASRYPNVCWRYTNALEAAQSVLRYPKAKRPRFAVFYEPGREAFSIASESLLFSSTPYVACKYVDSGEYSCEKVVPVANRNWLLPLSDKARKRVIGIAGSDAYGNVGVSSYFWDGGRLSPHSAR